MSEMNDIAKNLISILESMNMKSTADSFKLEFTKNFANSNSKLESNELLKTLYKRINELSNTNIPTNSNFKETNEKGEKRRQDAKTNNSNNKEESNKVLNTLVDKLIKKFDFDKQEEFKPESDLVNTKIFKNLMKKYSFTSEIDNQPGFANNKNAGLNNFHQDEKLNRDQIIPSNLDVNMDIIVNKDFPDDDDLPHFGSSNRNEPNANKNFNKNEEIYKNNQSIDDIITEHSKNDHNDRGDLNTLNSKSGNKNNNANNTFSKNESNINDDSIFAENEEENKNKLANKFQASSQLDNLIKNNPNSNNMFNMINNNNQNESQNMDSSSFFHNTQSILHPNPEDSQILNSMIDEYVDDDDPGFDLYECEMEFFKDTCKKLSEQYDFPRRAIYKSKFKNNESAIKELERNKNENENNNLMINNNNNNNKNNQNDIENNVEENNNNERNNIKSVKSKEIAPKQQVPKGESIFELETDKNKIAPKKGLLPSNFKFMEGGDKYYPIQFNNVILDCFNLKVIVDRERTGFEESREFKVIANSLVAGRYQVIEYLGEAAFSTAIKCLDIVDKKFVCLKIIHNNKEYFDQSIDEIKLLRFINANGDPDDKNFLKLYDYFYHKEHLFIVAEILKDNLYDFYRYLNDNNLENYFTLSRLQKITKQILVCLDYLHGLKLIHCDLKPENVLIKSISETQVKVIDFGSSCFIHDHLSSYVQSRSYRAPEVILGCKYDYKIDIWSLGCIIAELYTGNVLFQNDSIQSLLAKIMSIIGPFPDWMYEKGKLVKNYFTKEKLIFMDAVSESANNTGDNVFNNLSKSNSSKHQKVKKMHLLIPKRSSLRKRLKTNDENFYDFLKSLLELDPNKRLTAKEALNHKWITESKYD